MNTLESRASEGRRLILIGVLANILLAAVKIAGGLLGRSNALIADGIESSLDILSSGLMWMAVRYAGRPADRDHPYGHGKMESLAAVAGALILMAAGLSLGVHSVREIISLNTAASAANLPAPFTLIILLATITTKEWLYRWFSRRGKRLGSLALQADALHHRSDAITSLAALAGISAALIGGPAWAQADDWAALFSCALIVFNGVTMLRGALGEVLDEQASTEITEQILAAVQSVPGVTSVEKCRVRKSGLIRLADLHVRVAGDRTVRDGHRIAHAVKDHLMTQEFQLGDVTVHIEPEADE